MEILIAAVTFAGALYGALRLYYDPSLFRRELLLIRFATFNPSRHEGSKTDRALTAALVRHGVITKDKPRDFFVLDFAMTLRARDDLSTLGWSEEYDGLRLRVAGATILGATVMGGGQADKLVTLDRIGSDGEADQLRLKIRKLAPKEVVGVSLLLTGPAELSLECDVPKVRAGGLSLL